jgi:hypothetical protein
MRTAGIKIVRTPYEEPYHLHLWIEASNGSVNGRLEYYSNSKDLKHLGTNLQNYAGDKSQSVFYELGSEDPKKRSSCYLRIKVALIDSAGHSAITFRFNNNCIPPAGEISEFSIPLVVADVNRLGSLFVGFSELEHLVLFWSITDGKLFKTEQDFEVFVESP